VDVSKAHHTVNRIIKPISGAHRNSEGGGRAGQTWRDSKVDEGKERRCVCRIIDEVLEEFQISTLLSASVDISA